MGYLRRPSTIKMMMRASKLRITIVRRLWLSIKMTTINHKRTSIAMRLAKLSTMNTLAWVSRVRWLIKEETQLQPTLPTSTLKKPIDTLL